MCGDMNSNHQFTPGPWQAMSAHKAHNVAEYVSTESGLHICDVASYGASPDQRQANAKLISLAPEMFAALENTIQFHAEQSPAGKCICGTCQNFRSILSKLQ